LVRSTVYVRVGEDVARSSRLGFLKEELIERREEGCDVDAIAAEFTNAENTASEDDLLIICARFQAIRPCIKFSYSEPLDLEEIRVMRPYDSHGVEFNLEDEQLRDKIYGAWLRYVLDVFLANLLRDG